MHPRHAFTIPEMLVVIVIIGLLTVLVLPLINPHPQTSRRAQCLNNLKQIGLACAQYSSDYADRIPCGKPSVFLNMELLTNSLGSAKVLVCPSSQKKPVACLSDPQATDAANVSYTQQTGSTTGMIFQTNAEEVLFWDQGVAGNPCGPTGGIGLSWAATSNHKGAGGNILFNDGHVAWHITTPTNMPLGCLNP